jgi:hypothetical protein
MRIERDPRLRPLQGNWLLLPTLSPESKGQYDTILPSLLVFLLSRIRYGLGLTVLCAVFQIRYTDPDCIRTKSGQWIRIRIQEGKNDRQK